MHLLGVSSRSELAPAPQFDKFLSKASFAKVDANRSSENR
jgi:hypothetical protein